MSKTLRISFFLCDVLRANDEYVALVGLSALGRP